MNRIRSYACALVLLAAGSSLGASPREALCRANMVSHWMELATAHRHVLLARTAETGRSNAAVALAMFEAANAARPRFRSFLNLAPEPGAVDERLAVAVAARTVLDRLYPQHRQAFAEAYAALAPSDGASDSAARALGERAAAAAIARAQAQVGVPREPYRRLAPPGVYIVGDVSSLISDFDLQLTPWAMTSAAQFRPDPPPALVSDHYARDLGEVQRLGSANSPERTDAQTESAKFWFLIDLNPVLCEIASTSSLGLAASARLYAMFYMAADEAWLAAAEAKAHHQVWRPITAIRNADRDNNAHTRRDPYWQPLMATPAHPEYPCAHCVQAAAQAVVLRTQLSDPDRRFEIRSSTLPEASARNVTLTEYVEQTSLSRIYAGAHYRFSNAAGEAMGRAIGQRVLESWPIEEEDR